MSTRDRLARWLRLDPDRRVEAMQQQLAQWKRRHDRLRDALAEASRLARVAHIAKKAERERAWAAEAVADQHAQRLAAVQLVLGDGDLSPERRLDRIAQVFMQVDQVGGDRG